MNQQGYYSQPSIHGDTVVFVCEDDLWSVPASGGVARRLTASPAACSAPVFSPDGNSIAFTARDDGPMEAYVMDATGGEARRLTYHGGMARTVGWDRESRDVIFASNLGRRFMHEFHLHRVPAAGGRSAELPYGPARDIAIRPRSKGCVLGINSGDPARWKRYRGGTAGTLWIDREGKGQFAPLIKLAGNLAAPMWIGGRIWFLSDHEGFGNLYSATPTGRGLKRHTDHEDFFVRFPKTDGRRVVYHAGADLFVHDPGSGATSRIDVEWRSPRAQRARRFVDAAEFLEDAAIHPDGHGVACIARGAAYVMANFEGAPVRHGKISSTRYRLARWLPDKKRILVVSDEQGEEAFQIRSADATGRPRRIAGDFGRVLDLAVAPKGGLAAYSNHRTEICVLDLKTGRGKLVERSGFFRIHGMDWSPDGRWLAYGIQVDLRTTSIHLYDTRTGRKHQVTRPEFIDVGPAFDPGGKYLYFLSHRVFDPVYDNQYFDLGFPRGVVPCLLPLAKETPSPFDAALREPKSPAAEEHEDKKKKKKQAAVRTKIDLAGIADRVVAFPVPEAKYEAIRGGPGRVFFTSTPIEGALLDQGFSDETTHATLHVHDFEHQKTEPLLHEISDFTTTPDGKTLLVRAGHRLRVLSSAVGPKEVPAGEDAGRESGWLDLDRLRAAVVPGEEWKQMFTEAWRLQRDHYWTADMANIDWNAVHDRYRPLVDRVASRAEFSDLMWELQGELATSHCYELGGDYAPSPEWFQGFLGADLEFARTWKIRRIPQGDSWRRAARSPLAAPGLGLKPGDSILAVNGERVGAKKSPQECLVNQAGCEVQLTVRTKAGQKTVAVTTLRGEYQLRYRDWVETTRARVHQESKGRVGYIHIPDMGGWGYSEFHRTFRHEMDRDGLIVDVRHNGGGHVSQLLLGKLLRKRVGFDETRWEGRTPYPSESPAGPMVALTNEYAGSDGDIFSHCFKLYKLGPLIGKRTWGGVVGIWPRHALVDGAYTTQPEYSFWFQDVGFGVENYGTDPDIEVDITPQDHAKGRDTQLERGLLEIRKILRKRPKPPPVKRPDLKPPRLKKR